MIYAGPGAGAAIVTLVSRSALTVARPAVTPESNSSPEISKNASIAVVPAIVDARGIAVVTSAVAVAVVAIVAASGISVSSPAVTTEAPATLVATVTAVSMLDTAVEVPITLGSANCPESNVISVSISASAVADTAT